MIDTHSHIYLEQFHNDLNEVIDRAKEVGITKILLPNIDIDSISDMLKTVDRYPDLLLPMIGIHPSSVKANFAEDIKTIEKEIITGKYIAVGEIGIDLYWDKTFVKEQISAFNYQIELAIQHNLPIVIHMRDSYETIKNELGIYSNKELKGVFHCFTGNYEQAEWIINKGFYLGIGGVLTFKNSDLTKQLVNIPLDKLLLETDAPYLAPVPFRGKRNEPSYIKYVAERLAISYNIEINKLISITNDNAKELFNI